MLRNLLKWVTKGSRKPLRLIGVHREIFMWFVTYAALLTTPIVFGIEQSLHFNSLNVFIMFCDCCFLEDSVTFVMQNKKALRINYLFQAPFKVVVDLVVHISSVICLFVTVLSLILGLNGRGLAWFSVVRMVSFIVWIVRICHIFIHTDLSLSTHKSFLLFRAGASGQGRAKSGDDQVEVGEYGPHGEPCCLPNCLVTYIC